METPARVKVGLFDAAGRKVAAVPNADMPAGRYSVNLASRGVGPGLYICEFEAGEKKNLTKITFK